MRYPVTGITHPGQGKMARVRLFVMGLMISTLLGGCAYQEVEGDDADEKRRKSAESNTALGQMYMERGQNEVAFGKLKKAIAEDPDYAPAHTVLGVLYERLGEMDMAGKHYRLAYEADPKGGDVNNNYGTWLCKTGETKKALSHFLKALDDPFYTSPAVALSNAGSCALGAGDMVDANKYLRNSLKIDPAFPDTLFSMARLSYAEGSYLQARAFMQRYEAAVQHNASSLLLAFKLETAMHDDEAADAYMYTLENNFSDSEQAAEARRISGR